MNNEDQDLYTSADIEAQQLAYAANAAAATNGLPPFDLHQHGPALRQAVRTAIDVFGSVYEATTACATDEGFRHDEAADHYALDCALERKAELEREMR